MLVLKGTNPCPIVVGVMFRLDLHLISESLLNHKIIQNQEIIM